MQSYPRQSYSTKNFHKGIIIKAVFCWVKISSATITMKPATKLTAQIMAYFNFPFFILSIAYGQSLQQYKYCSSKYVIQEAT